MRGMRYVLNLWLQWLQLTYFETQWPKWLPEDDPHNLDLLQHGTFTFGFVAVEVVLGMLLAAVQYCNATESRLCSSSDPALYYDK
jgi:hypothetical protein